MPRAPPPRERAKRGAGTKARGRHGHVHRQRVPDTERSRKDAVGRESKSILTETETGVHDDPPGRPPHPDARTADRNPPPVEDHRESPAWRTRVRPGGRTHEDQKIGMATRPERLQHVPVRRPAERGGEGPRKAATRLPAERGPVDREIGQGETEHRSGTRGRTQKTGEPTGRDDVVVPERGERTRAANADEHATAASRNPVEPRAPRTGGLKTLKDPSSLAGHGRGGPCGTGTRSAGLKEEKNGRPKGEARPAPGAAISPAPGRHARRLRLPP